MECAKCLSCGKSDIILKWLVVATELMMMAVIPVMQMYKIQMAVGLVLVAEINIRLMLMVCVLILRL